MFLNEQCKDAMNMMEVIESIQLSLQDKMNILWATLYMVAKR